MRAGALALILTLVAAPVLAGCIGIGDAGDDDELDPTNADGAAETFVPAKPDFDFLDAIDTTHPVHDIPALHTETFGLDLVGHEAFNGFYPVTTQPAFSDIDVHDGRDLAALGSMVGELGVTLVDISERHDPVPLSFIPASGGEWDARFSEDGNYLFFGCQVTSTTGNEHYVKGDCEGSTDLHAPQDIGASGPESVQRVLAYDVSDPSTPQLVGAVDAAAHNVWSRDIGGTTYVFTNGVEIIRFDPNADPTLEVVATVPGVHDVMVERHPITGDWLLYTGGGPLAIYEINDPGSPTAIFEDALEGVTAWHEQTVSTHVIDGRVLLAGGGEAGISAGDLGNVERHMASVVDVTDPTSPEPVGQWTLPVSFVPPHRGYAFSIHNMAFTPYGQLAIAWYHAGVWVIDVSTQERQAEPVTLGFYQPHEDFTQGVPPVYFQLDLNTPSVWGAAWTDDGHLVVPDMYTGLYVLEPAWGLYPGSSSDEV